MPLLMRVSGRLTAYLDPIVVTHHLQRRCCGAQRCGATGPNWVLASVRCARWATSCDDRATCVDSDRMRGRCPLPPLKLAHGRPRF